MWRGEERRGSQSTLLGKCELTGLHWSAMGPSIPEAKASLGELGWV